MKSGVKRILIAATAVLIAAGGLGGQPPAQSRDTLFNRLCRMLGINPKLSSALTRPRGGGDDIAPHGKRIVVASLDGKTSRVLWECGDCWSLAVSKGDVTAVRKDGIWLIRRTDGASRQVAAQTGIAVQIGALADRPEAMLAMTASGTGAASVYSFAAFDLTTGKAVPPPPDTAGQYRGTDVALFPRPDAIRGSRVLSTSKGLPMKILVATISGDAVPTLSLNNIVLAPPQGVERFDPIWLDDNTVAFIERDF